MMPVIHKKYFLTRQKDIYYIAYVLEGYDGICNVTTIDPTEARIEISVPDDFVADFQEVALFIAREVRFYETAGK